MQKNEVVQTRVNKELRDRLQEKAAEQDKTVAEFLREVVEGVVSHEAETKGESIKRDTFRDIYTIGRGEEEYRSVPEVIQESWEKLMAPNRREQIRELVLEDSKTVYIAGQGSSLAVGYWLAARLHDHGVDACVYTAEDVPVTALDGNDALLLISRSGQTKSVCDLAERAVETSEVSIVGVTSDQFAIDQKYQLTLQLTVPDINERTGPYATRSVVLQIAALQLLLFDETPTKEIVDTRFDAVNQFIDEQLTEDGGGDEDEVQNVVEIGDTIMGIYKNSPFWSAVEVVDAEGDLAADPIVASLGRYHPLGREVTQKHIELLHTHAAYQDLGSIRDTLLNVLYRGDAYLLTVLPPTETGEYRRCRGYLFEYETSIQNLLKLNAEPQDLRMLTMSFNDADGVLEQAVTDQSLYGEDGVIMLPDYDPMTNDLIVLVANYLLALAILTKRWNQDRLLRQAIIRGPNPNGSRNSAITSVWETEG